MAKPGKEIDIQRRKEEKRVPTRFVRLYVSAGPRVEERRTRLLVSGPEQIETKGFVCFSSTGGGGF